MATEQMAQMLGQLQQLSQHLKNQQQMFHQSLEMQRQSSQAQMETFIDLGAAQVAKTTYDARDVQTKRSPKWKVPNAMRKLGRIGGTNFCVEVSRCFRHAAAILDWAKDKYDQTIPESDTEGELGEIEPRM